MLVGLILLTLLSTTLLYLLFKLSERLSYSESQVFVLEALRESEIEEAYGLGIKHAMEDEYARRQVEQSLADDANTVTVARYGDRAYWVSEDGLVCASIDDDNNIDYEDIVKVDTIAMDKEEVKTIMEILDILKEGEQ